MGKKYYGLLDAGFTSDYLADAPQYIGQKVACRCPRCSDNRKKRMDKCAQITAVNDGFIWVCHQCNEGKGEFITTKTKEQELREWQQNNPMQNNNFSNQNKTISTVNVPPMKPKVKPQITPLCTTYSTAFLAFWYGRGISEATLKKARVNEVNQYMPKQGGAVLSSQFPITYKGEIVAYKYRAIATKDFAISKDSELAFFNFDWLEQANKAKDKVKMCVVVEGEVDAFSFIECGINCVISPPNGAANSQFMDKHFADKAFDNVEQFVLATDNDPAGIKFRDEFARRVGKHRCKFLVYPINPSTGQECKDPNEVLMSLGKTALTSINLREFPIDGVHLADDVLDKINVIREDGYSPYFKVGLDDLDDKFTWALSAQLTAVSAAPNSAKSDFIFNIALRLAILHGAKIGIMSPETGDAADVYAALAKIYLGKHFTKKPIGAPRNSAIEISTDDEAADAIIFIKQHFFVYSCESENINTEEFLRIAAELVVSYGVNMIIGDPYNYLSDAFAPEHGEAMMSNYLNANLQKIKHFCAKYDVHTVLIPHPKQMQPFERMLDFGQINGGAAWGNKVDNLILLNRLYGSALGNYPQDVQTRGAKSSADGFNEDLGDHVEVIIRKVKKSYAGRRAEIRLAYELTTGRFGVASEDSSSLFLNGWEVKTSFEKGGSASNGDEYGNLEFANHDF